MDFHLQEFKVLNKYKVTLVMAMKYEKAAINGLIEDFSTVLCFLADIIIFGIIFPIQSILGAVCIVIACLVISVSKIE